MKITDSEEGQELSFFQLVLVVLSIYVLLALFIQTAFTLPPEVDRLLDLIDSGICVIFIADFAHRFYRAPSKWKFLKWGWIDFVSSIPQVPAFRAGRIVRVIRVLRLLRAFRSTKILVNFVYHNRARSTLGAAALITLCLALFSSIAILNFERVPDSNIKTPSDALWWAFVTVATVGYGDKYPVTTEGRLVAALLMTAGVGLFGTFTAFVAGFFLESKKENDNLQMLTDEVRMLREKIEAMEEKRNTRETED